MRRWWSSCHKQEPSNLCGLFPVLPWYTLQSFHHLVQSKRHKARLKTKDLSFMLLLTIILWLLRDKWKISMSNIKPHWAEEYNNSVDNKSQT